LGEAQRAIFQLIVFLLPPPNETIRGLPPALLTQQHELKNITRRLKTTLKENNK